MCEKAKAEHAEEKQTGKGERPEEVEPEVPQFAHFIASSHAGEKS
jgi:hypothetical protein